MNSKFAVLSLWIALAMLGSCNRHSSNSSAPAPAAANTTYDTYLEQNASGYDWFVNASDGYSGVPRFYCARCPT